ncbi:hypothetical protein MMAD_17600 [Mycolicibacterium madagascariense]|uniref:DoxX family protein n=1 Tax=Mycolicibacterium madagascariense TaxID=212765 RepID=A0A7I7XDJ2_9MYCO|nr:hypothetical protein [Mycolicibacterium madagascariense]MCV7015172.1 hypothetical protein [Mycolicibacterium madagascariense]BBZ27465.1 hypothetical protein MMAD_17600 [Mycolicibacterium madagascariense]
MRRRANARVAGLVLAAIGVAQLANPHLFDPLARRVFPRRTRLQTYVNGAVLTLVGLGIRLPRTRGLATIVGVGYAAHVSRRATRTARRAERTLGYRTSALGDASPLR